MVSAKHLDILSPIDDVRATAVYRREGALELVRRSLGSGGGPDMTASHGLIDTAFTVNGQEVQVEALPTERLTSVLREKLGLTGTKVGCDAGDCGACTVLLDGEVICACMVAASQVDGRAVTTIEGLAGDALGRRLQQAFLDHGAAQCGICTPGMLMTAQALLATTEHPDVDQVRDALGGVLCRCTGYQKILDAVMAIGRPISPADKNRAALGPAVGRSIRRLDGQAKVEGRDIFGADGLPADALLVKVVRSPFHHARFSLGALDRFVADHPGVISVLTAKDVPGENCYGVIPAFADQPVFADEIVRFKGEAVAAIVGEPAAIKVLAAADFPITWDELPALLTIDDAKNAWGSMPSREQAGQSADHGPGGMRRYRARLRGRRRDRRA